MFVSTPWVHSKVSVIQPSTSVNRLHILFLNIDRKQMLMSFLWQDVMYHTQGFGLWWIMEYIRPVLWLSLYFSACIQAVYKSKSLLPFNNSFLWNGVDYTSNFHPSLSLITRYRVSKCCGTVPGAVNHSGIFDWHDFPRLLSHSASTDGSFR